MSVPFTLTPDEANFVRWYVYDVGRASDGRREAGPATKWLWDHGIFPTTMQPFQLAAQRSKPDYIEWITEPPRFPFKTWAGGLRFPAISC